MALKASCATPGMHETATNGKYGPIIINETTKQDVYAMNEQTNNAQFSATI